MKLLNFRVRNYRSINDSGEISASQITALLGRNESGKSNLLRGLYSINPIDGFKALKPIKDFPRHLRLETCTDSTPVLETKWQLEDDEIAALLELLPRATTVKSVSICRSYKGRSVGFIGLGEIPFDEADIKTKVKKTSAAVRAQAQKLDNNTVLDAAADAFESASIVTKPKDTWGANFIISAKALRTALAGRDADLSDKQEETLTELEELAEQIVGDKDAQVEAREWVVNAMPKFIYVDEYPELDGHQDIAAYLQRKSQGTLNYSDKNFEKLCKVAGLKPQALQTLLEQMITKLAINLRIVQAQWLHLK